MSEAKSLVIPGYKLLRNLVFKKMIAFVLLSLLALASGRLEPSVFEVNDTAPLTCEECTTLATNAEDLLSLFDKYAMYECSQLPSPDVQPCQEVVEAIVPFVIAQVIEKYPPEVICQKLEYCPRSLWRFWW